MHSPPPTPELTIMLVALVAIAFFGGVAMHRENMARIQAERAAPVTSAPAASR